MRTATLQQRGFSLVEITIALGIAAVALISLVGLLGVAANGNRAAGRDTALVSMTQQVLADLRAADFDALWLDKPPRDKDGLWLPVKAATGSAPPAPVPSIYFFTADGTPVPGDDAVSKNPETAYQCTVRKLPDPATRTANDGPFNLLRLELDFFSPPGSKNNAAVLNHQIVHASLARY